MELDTKATFARNGQQILTYSRDKNTNTHTHTQPKL